MIGRIFTADHRVFDTPELLEWNVKLTGTVPCDSFSVTFLYKPEMAEVLHMAAGLAIMEDGETVLRGIVDEHTVELGPDGMLATISGRGYAARLLDNESRPLTYENATLAEIVANHVTPYGIETEGVANIRAAETYTVAAGSSQWKALKDFCETYGGFIPRFARTGELLATPEAPGRSLRIGDGDPVLSCVLREDRYGVLTEVLLIDKKRKASYSVKNQEMLRRGGQCRKVVYTPGQTTWAAARYTGEYQIEQSKAEQKVVTITLPGSFPAFPGDVVTLELNRMGLQGSYRVEEAESSFTPARGATVTLTLKERG